MRMMRSKLKENPSFTDGKDHRESWLSQNKPQILSFPGSVSVSGAGVHGIKYAEEGAILRMCESGASSSVYTTVRSDNTLPGRWVAKLVERWVAKLVAHMLATAALWVRIQTSIKHTNWAPLAKERQTHSSPPKNIYKKSIHYHTPTPLKQKVQ